MNPFNLNGPYFLLFYVILCVLMLVLSNVLITVFERKLPIPKISLKDPYLIAYLRKGMTEAIILATMTLKARGLLVEDNGSRKLKTSRPESVNMAQYPIEKAVLTVFNRKTEAEEVLNRKACKQSCDDYEKLLSENNLIINNYIYHQRLYRLCFPFCIASFFSLIRFFTALSEGRNNVLFLFILFICYLGGLWYLLSYRKTDAGLRLLGDLKALFTPLYKRTKTMPLNEFLYEHTLIAAVFGMDITPSYLNTVRHYFPSLNRDSKKDSSSSCGSSCGSSSGSGCGGCGGCGS